MRPSSAEDLGVVLDQSGRPYDNYWGPQGTTVERRSLTNLQVDRGRLEVVDGDALYGPQLLTIRDTESANYPTAEELELRVYWQQFSDPALVESMEGDVPSKLYPAPDGTTDSTTEGEMVEAIIGVEVAVPGTTVVRWGAFELAYQSKDGLGAITSRKIIEAAAPDFEFGDAILTRELTDDKAYLLADLDDVPGHDLFLFDNGGGSRSNSGDGRYELTEGFDENDQLVSVMLWVSRFPWRLAVSEGTPPPDVTEREQELTDCIEGRRLIDKWGRCT